MDLTKKTSNFIKTKTAKVRLFYLAFLISCVLDSADAQVTAVVAREIPADAIAPEDAAFNSSYMDRSIPTVTGKLLNISMDEIKKLTIECTVVTPYSQSQFQQTKPIMVHPDGSFEIRLDNALPYQQIWFSISDIFYTALYVNTNLFLQLDMTRLKEMKRTEFNGNGVRYLGPDGPLNTYLNNYQLYKRPEKDSLYTRVSTIIPQQSTDSVMALLKNIFDSMRSIQDSYIAENPSPFGWILEEERLSDYYGQVLTKYWGKTMGDSLWKKMRRHKCYVTTNESALFYIYLVTYVNFLPGHWRPTGWKDVAALPDLNVNEKMVIDSLRAGELWQSKSPYTPENIKKWTIQLQPRIQRLALLRNLDKNIWLLDSLFPPAKADFLKMKIDAGKSLGDQQLAFNYISRTSHTPWCLKVMKTELDSLTARIDEVDRVLAASATGGRDSGFGRPLIRTSFGASLYDASGINAADLLAGLKRSFFGKAMIIDRWATWCAPCLGEMSHSKELQQESADLPVVFIYLCTTNNSSEQKWKEKVAELKQPGIHVLIDAALDAELSAYFSFAGYPGYAFIDKAGKYHHGAFQWLSEIKDRNDLETLLK